MRDGPDIAFVASLLGDPARANMLSAMMDAGALTAGELAREAGVTAQTASSHLGKLEKAGLIIGRRQGRHSYFSLADGDVALVVEGLMGLAARTGARRVRPGPKEPQLRQARVCYDHLAGEMGVALLDRMLDKGLLCLAGEELAVTNGGEAFAQNFGLDLAVPRGSRRPVCKACLDWSMRRNHLAGVFGAALLRRLFDLGWATRRPGTRIVDFTLAGRASFEAQEWLEPPAAIRAA